MNLLKDALRAMRGGQLLAAEEAIETYITETERAASQWRGVGSKGNFKKGAYFVEYLGKFQNRQAFEVRFNGEIIVPENFAARFFDSLQDAQEFAELHEKQQKTLSSPAIKKALTKFKKHLEGGATGDKLNPRTRISQLRKKLPSLIIQKGANEAVRQIEKAIKENKVSVCFKENKQKKHFEIKAEAQKLIERSTEPVFPFDFDLNDSIDFYDFEIIKQKIENGLSHGFYFELFYKGMPISNGDLALFDTAEEAFAAAGVISAAFSNPLIIKSAIG